VRVELTSSGLTVRCLAARLLCRTCRKRRRIARWSDALITHGSSGGWGRASGLLLFRETLLPSELHREKSETPAGVEPASRSGCSRPPEPSGPTSSRNKSRRWDSNPLGPRYEGGARPVEHRRPNQAASAGVEPTRPEFRAPVPSRGPGQRSRASGGTRTRTRPFTGGVRARRGALASGWLAGVEPAQPRFTAGSRCRLEFRPSAPTWTRTRNSAFAGPRDVRFTIEAWTVPRPGVEPGPAPSEGAMMSLSPPGQQASDQGGTRTLTPRWARPSDDRVSACSTTWPFANSGPWRELNPHLPGASRPSSPLDDTPINHPVAPQGVEP
jgi:hypothetical protein